MLVFRQIDKCSSKGLDIHTRLVLASQPRIAIHNVLISLLPDSLANYLNRSPRFTFSYTFQ